MWAWRCFTLAKRPLDLGMRTPRIGKKAPIYGHGDTLQWQKRPLCLGMETLCTSKKASICGHPDTLQWQKYLYI